MVRRINNNPEYNSRRIMRDSAGRIYEERWSLVQNPLPGPPGLYGDSPLPPPSQETFIQISDPIAHTYLNCSVPRQICTLTDYRGSTDAIYKPDVTVHKALPDGSVQTTQSLGSKRIEGFDAQGYRVVTMYKPGPASDQRVAEDREFWYSSQLGIDLVSYVTSRASGDEHFQVTHLKTGDPDPKYFNPPAGYRIVDQRQSAPPAEQTATTGSAPPPLPPEPAATPAAAQPSPTPPTSRRPVPTIQVTSRLVVLDVTVTDKQGRPVKGLKQSDFNLTEDRTPQAISSFAEHDASEQPSAPPPPPALPPNTFADHAPVTNNIAMTVIVFDTSSLSWQDAGYARYEVSEYLKKIAPGTPICIFELNQYGLQLLQDFTTASQLLRQAVDSKRNIQWPRFSGSSILIRRGFAVRDIARYLSSFPGRKNLIWFGGGPAGGIYDSQYSAGTNFPNVYTNLFSDVDSFTADLEGATDTLTLSRVALYTVDPRGVVFNEGEELDILQQGADLTEVAAATGGKAYYDSNAIDKVVAQVVAAGSHYYTLSYTPTDAHWDGSFRKVKVQLANNGQTYLASLQPPTQLKAPLRLAYRNGYYALPNAPRTSLSAVAATSRPISYAPKGDPNTAEQPNPLDEAMSFGAVPPFQVLFLAHISPAPATEKLARNAPLPQDNYLSPQYRRSPYRDYQIHYSVDPRDLQFAQHGADSYEDTIEFIAVVYDAEGAIVNSFINTVSVDIGIADYTRIQRDGLGIEIPIAIPAKGDFYLRLGVQDLNSNRLGALEIPVESIKLNPEASLSNSTKTH
jgi:VWFA-related protein